MPNSNDKTNIIKALDEYKKMTKAKEKVKYYYNMEGSPVPQANEVETMEGTEAKKLKNKLEEVEAAYNKKMETKDYMVFSESKYPAPPPPYFTFESSKAKTKAKTKAPKKYMAVPKQQAFVDNGMYTKQGLSIFNENVELFKHYPYNIDALSYMQDLYDVKLLSLELKVQTFQWVMSLCHYGSIMQTWTKDISIGINLHQLPAVLSSLNFILRNPPEEINFTGNNVGIRTPGFDTLYSKSKPDAYVDVKSARNIANKIANMNDGTKVELSEFLKNKQNIELFKWGKEKAIPYRRDLIGK